MTTSTNPPRTLPSRLWYTPFIALLLAFVALTWANYHFAENYPGGNDFLVNWLGTRSFIYKGQSPYSEETALEIQRMVQGIVTQEGENELRVFSPFYSEILFAPFALVENYTLARALWMTVVEVAILGIGILSIRLAGWRVKIWMVPIYLLFTLVWYPGLHALVTGNAVVIVTLFIIGAFLAIQKGQDVLAGLLLALATIKPHLVFLLILFVLVWAFSHRRWTLIGWTFGWTSFLFLIGVMFMPDWLMQNIWVLLRFPNLHPVFSIGSVFETMWPGVGTQLKWGLAIFLGLLLLFEWWRGWGKGFNYFLWSACLTLVISLWIGFSSNPSDIVLLYPAIVLFFSIIKEHWNVVGDWIVLGTMILLGFGLWGWFIQSIGMSYQPGLDVFQYISVPLFVIICLYWIRWWVIRPTRTISIS